MSDINKEIGKRIAYLRKEQHMTQEQLAEEMDISLKHCSNVECGRASLSLERFIDLCDILDTNLDYLIRGSLSNQSRNVPEFVKDLFGQADEKEYSILNEYMKLYIKIKSMNET